MEESFETFSLTFGFNTKPKKKSTGILHSKQYEKYSDNNVENCARSPKNF